MADAVTDAVRRKVGLDNARDALRSGTRSVLRHAIRGLPPNGKKASALRARLVSALGELESDAGDDAAGKQQSSGLQPGLRLDGVLYRFAVAETGELALFSPFRDGCSVRVVLNEAHPFVRALGGNLEHLEHNTKLLIASWARYELDNESDRQQQVTRDARIDWSRCLRRIVDNPG